MSSETLSESSSGSHLFKKFLSDIKTEFIYLEEVYYSPVFANLIDSFFFFFYFSTRESILKRRIPKQEILSVGRLRVSCKMISLG